MDELGGENYYIGLLKSIISFEIIISLVLLFALIFIHRMLHLVLGKGDHLGTGRDSEKW